MAFEPTLRKGVATLTLLAIGLVATVGVGAVVLYSGTLSGSAGNGVTTETSFLNSSRTTTLTTTFSNTSASTTSQTGSWTAWAVANATLGYYKTQQYLQHAWNYTFNIMESGTNPQQNETFISNNIGVLGMTFTGNWTTGYNLTFYPSEVNVTVQFTPHATYYPIFSFSARNGSAFQQTIQFNSTQQRAISIAMQNASVSGYLKSNTSQSFVDDAFLFPSANKTFGGDYLVWVFQANGPRILAAFVNLQSGKVVATYASTRTVETCYSQGPCFSSPWP